MTKVESINLIKSLPANCSFSGQNGIPKNNAPAVDNKKKLLITLSCLGAIGTAVITTTIIKKKPIKFTKAQEEAFQKLVEEGKIKPEYLDFFKKIYSKKNIKINEVYDSMADMLGYKNLAPKLKIADENSKEFSSFNPITTLMTINKKMGNVVSTMRHEFEHVRQNEFMYRVFGKDAMADANIEAHLNTLKQYPEYCISSLGKKFEELTPDELNKFKSLKRDELINEFNTDFYEKIAKAKGKPTEVEEKLAKRYIENARVYDGSHGIIEDEAYKREIEFDNMFSAFLNIVKKPSA